MPGNLRRRKHVIVVSKIDRSSPTNLEPPAAPSDTTSFSSLTRRQSFTHLVNIIMIDGEDILDDQDPFFLKESCNYVSTWPKCLPDP